MCRERQRKSYGEGLNRLTEVGAYATVDSVQRFYLFWGASLLAWRSFSLPAGSGL
jgi:hypothetical protein